MCILLLKFFENYRQCIFIIFSTLLALHRSAHTHRTLLTIESNLYNLVTLGCVCRHPHEHVNSHQNTLKWNRLSMHEKLSVACSTRDSSKTSCLISASWWEFFFSGLEQCINLNLLICQNPLLCLKILMLWSYLQFITNNVLLHSFVLNDPWNLDVVLYRRLI